LQYFIHELENHNPPIVYEVEHMRMKYSIRFQSIEEICIVLDYSLNFSTYIDYEVNGFTNPIEALEHYKTNCTQYGLVISDVLMPGMTGFNLLKNIKKIDATISFFLMSAYDIIEVSEIEVIKIDGFIQILIRIKEFLSTIQKHLIIIPIP
jgi:DNA-binding NtrC family response regulator